MNGYYIDLIRSVYKNAPILLVLLGESHIKINSIIEEFNIIGLGAGSLFFFKGSKRLFIQLSM